MRRFTASFSQEYQVTPFNKKDWTAIIPAAGQGTRLGYSKAKILFPVGGKLIIEYIAALLNPFVHEGIFVFSSKNKEDVENTKYQGFDKERKVVIDGSLGMAHSIEIALPFVQTPFVIIIWGDQVALSQSTVQQMVDMMQSELAPDVVLPLFQQENPYVHYVEDQSGKLVEVLQKREGDVLPSRGLADAGIFAFRTEKLRDFFKVFTKEASPMGKETGEWNFIPLLPWFEQNDTRMLTFELLDSDEARGVNSRKDAVLIEKWLSAKK